MRPSLVSRIALGLYVLSTRLATAQTTDPRDDCALAPLDEPTAARRVGLGDFAGAAEALERGAVTAPSAQAMAWRAAAVRLRLALGDEAAAERSLDAAEAAAAREASLRPTAWALVETLRARCDEPSAAPRCEAVLRHAAERLGEAPLDVRMRALVASARAAASPDERRRIGLDALRAFRRTCEATAPRVRCVVPDAFATLSRSVRRRARHAERIGYVREAALDTMSDAARAPTDGGRSDRARELAAEAARIVWEVDARRLDAPVADPALPMTDGARARWFARALAPWARAQMHALAVLGEAMWQARGLGGEHHACMRAMLAERAVQFARRMDRISAPPLPTGAEVIEVWDAPPPPWDSYLDDAREGFAACRDDAIRARWPALLARCERGLTDLDRARFPAADEIVMEPSAAMEPRSTLRVE